MIFHFHFSIFRVLNVFEFEKELIAHFFLHRHSLKILFLLKNFCSVGFAIIFRFFSSFLFSKRKKNYRSLKKLIFIEFSSFSFLLLLDKFSFHIFAADIFGIFGILLGMLCCHQISETSRGETPATQYNSYQFHGEVRMWGVEWGGRISRGEAIFFGWLLKHVGALDKLFPPFLRRTLHQTGIRR